MIRTARQITDRLSNRKGRKQFNSVLFSGHSDAISIGVKQVDNSFEDPLGQPPPLMLPSTPTSNASSSTDLACTDTFLYGSGSMHASHASTITRKESGDTSHSELITSAQLDQMRSSALHENHAATGFQVLMEVDSAGRSSNTGSAHQGIEPPAGGGSRVDTTRQ